MNLEKNLQNYDGQGKFFRINQIALKPSVVADAGGFQVE